VQFNDDFRRYASTFSAMDANAAAKTLEGMLTTNPNLVIDILWSISTDNRAAILNELQNENPRSASRIARLMEPERVELPVATAPPLPIPTPPPSAVIADEPIDGEEILESDEEAQDEVEADTDETDADETDEAEE
jgi:hypothetical protein